MAHLANLIDSMTKGATTGAMKNGVNMQDLQQLAEVTKRITAQQPGIATNLAPEEPRSTSSNPHPLSPTNAPPIKHLRQSLRLQELQINKDVTASDRIERAIQKAIKEKDKEHERAKQ